jgi:hypothetical protein
MMTLDATTDAGVARVKAAFEAADAGCTSFNKWDYDHGHSQCTDENCCHGEESESQCSMWYPHFHRLQPPPWSLPI